MMWIDYLAHNNMTSLSIISMIFHDPCTFTWAWRVLLVVITWSEVARMNTNSTKAGSTTTSGDYIFIGEKDATKLCCLVPVGSLHAKNPRSWDQVKSVDNFHLNCITFGSKNSIKILLCSIPAAPSCENTQLLILPLPNESAFGVGVPLADEVGDAVKTGGTGAVVDTCHFGSL